MDDIVITQNDFGMSIKPTLKDDSGTAFNLTGCTVEVTTIWPDKTKHVTSATIIDSANGIVEIVIPAAGTVQTGLYYIYIAINNSTTSHITSQDVINYTVIAENGGVA
jgi:hypothetical protein